MFMFGRLGGLLVGGVVESSWRLACRWSRLGGLLVGGVVESSWRPCYFQSSSSSKSGNGLSDSSSIGARCS